MTFNLPKTKYENRLRFLNMAYPEDKAMKNEPPENWVEVAVFNRFPYNAGDEVKHHFFYRDLMRYLRKKLRTEGEIWLPGGVLTCLVTYIPHPKYM